MGRRTQHYVCALYGKDVYLIAVLKIEVPRDLTLEDYLDGEDSDDDQDWRISRT